MKKKVILTIIGIIIISCIGLYQYQTHKWEKERAVEQARMQEIANELGVAPSWEAIVEYVDCEILVAGSNKEDMISQLERIGELYWHEVSTNRNDDTLVIYFGEGFIHGELGIIYTVFNEENILISTSRHYDLMDPREMYCP